ncbi:MAG: hypothetical protein ACHQQR_04385 [Gemmatimonadales bacterium]
MSLNTIETRIVTQVVASLAVMGWAPVSANDGGDENFPCATLADVISAIEGTGQATIIFRSQGQSKRGWVLFIEGNDRDIVSDWTTNLPDAALDTDVAVTS